MKPIFGRSINEGDSQPETASLNSDLVLDPCTFSSIGSPAASSITR